MSRYLQINDGEPADLSSNVGWSQFLEWAKASDGFDALTEFAENGTTDQPQMVCDQIEAAAEDNPPDADVKTITETLCEYMDGENGSATVV